MQEVIDTLMIEVCAEKSASPEQVFFILCFFFPAVFIIMVIQEKNLNKSVEDMEILVVT